MPGERDEMKSTDAHRERKHHLKLAASYRFGGAMLLAAGFVESTLLYENGNWLAVAGGLVVGIASERLMTDHADEHAELLKSGETAS